jgi:hypothetical protein
MPRRVQALALGRRHRLNSKRTVRLVETRIHREQANAPGY